MLRNSFAWLKPALVHRAPQPLLMSRALHFSPRVLSGGSLFGDITTQKQPESAASASVDPPADPKMMLPADDAVLQKKYLQEAQKKQETSARYVSAEKRRLFDLNVAKNGFFKNNEIIYDKENGKHYKLLLTDAEIEVLEPSVYIKSFRIQSSMKKATLVNRFVRGYNVKNAINQLHFSPKKMATELEKLLKTGLKLASLQGMSEDLLYIHALWVGPDGEWRKRIEWKGRGRVGMLRHRYVHLKAILKLQQTRDRLAWEKEKKIEATKPKTFLNNEPLNFTVHGVYKW